MSIQDEGRAVAVSAIPRDHLRARRVRLEDHLRLDAPAGQGAMDEVCASLFFAERIARAHRKKGRGQIDKDLLDQKVQKICFGHAPAFWLLVSPVAL